MRKISEARLLAYWTLLNGKEPEPPTCSRLFSLVPLYAKTAFVESATGYTIRLAVAHCMLTKDLVWKEILPLLGRDYLLECGKGSRFLTRDGRSLNGLQESAREWVRVLEKLTLRSDLAGTTMLPWAGVFSQKGLLKANRAWCAACYEEWRESGSTAYEPLIWTIDVVKVCPVHGGYLVQVCPHEGCQKRLPIISKTSYPGCCSYCGRWLGTSPPPGTILHAANVVSAADIETGGNNSERLTLKWHRWAARAVGELIAVGQTAGESGNLTQVLAGLSSYLGRVESGQVEGTPRGRRQARTLMYNVRERGQVPTLPTLLRLCYELRLEPTPLLARGKVIPSTETEDVETPKRLRHKRRMRRRFDGDYVRGYLETVLESDEQPRPCMREVAERLGYQTPQIARHFPQLCAAISALYLVEQNARREERMEVLKGKVREATLAVHAQGMKPTVSRVGTLLGRPGLLRSPELLTVWRDVRRQLEGSHLPGS